MRGNDSGGKDHQQFPDSHSGDQSVACRPFCLVAIEEVAARWLETR